VDKIITQLKQRTEGKVGACCGQQLHTQHEKRQCYDALLTTEVALAVVCDKLLH
jgi:hypothetical protein